MLRLSKKADYALLADAAPGGQRGRGAPCRRASWPRPTTSRRSCWPRCCRSSCGRGCSSRTRAFAAGYGLARPAGAISVADVIQADRRAADGDGLLGDGPQLRPVREVQHPRSALAHQGSHRLGAGRDVGGGTGGGHGARRRRRCRCRCAGCCGCEERR